MHFVIRRIRRLAQNAFYDSLLSHRLNTILFYLRTMYKERQHLFAQCFTFNFRIRTEGQRYWKKKIY